MSLDLEPDDDFALRRLERLERQYRRAQFVLAGARASYESLRAAPGTTQLQLRDAWQRIERSQAYLADAQSTLEFLEDQNYAASALRYA